MNRTKIEWTDLTLNPVVGCTHNCPYCYARKQAKRQKQKCQLCYEFTPHPHLERLEQLNPKQKPKKIFIDSMWDWCCPVNDPEWLEAILKKMRECSQHTFQILTKHPRGYSGVDFPENVWLLCTVERWDFDYRISELLSTEIEASVKGVSFEPLLSPIVDSLPLLEDLDWIIIGAETGNRKGKITPNPEWVESILDQANGTPVFIKDNLAWLKGEFGNRQQFPEMQKRTIQRGRMNHLNPPEISQQEAVNHASKTI